MNKLSLLFYYYLYYYIGYNNNLGGICFFIFFASRSCWLISSHSIPLSVLFHKGSLGGAVELYKSTSSYKKRG